MGKKYFTLSFDDGLEQDKKILKLMKKYELKGTFNLNSGMFGLTGEVKGMGTFAFQDCEAGVRHRWPFTYVSHNRIPEDEILQVYEGMEIATHGFHHESLRKLNEQGVLKSVGRDKETLEKLTGKKILGHAYAYGATSPQVESYLKKQGYLYARAVFSSGSFEFPENPLNFRPSGSVVKGNAIKLVENFKAAEAGSQDLLLYLWGHGYEMDYGMGTASWESLERLFAAIAGQDDIIYCTNSEAFLHK